MISFTCPYCGTRTTVLPYVEGNIARYGGPRVFASRCCGGAIHIQPQITFKIQAVPAYKEDVDIWGNVIYKREVTDPQPIYVKDF